MLPIFGYASVTKMLQEDWAFEDRTDDPERIGPVSPNGLSIGRGGAEGI
jgi:hypothetical protein